MIASWDRPDGVSLRLILIRHGEPEASARGRCYGKLDIGLSANGRAQMARLGKALASVSVDAFYASPEGAERSKASKGFRVPPSSNRGSQRSISESSKV